MDIKDLLKVNLRKLGDEKRAFFYAKDKASGESAVREARSDLFCVQAFPCPRRHR